MFKCRELLDASRGTEGDSSQRQGHKLSDGAPSSSSGNEIRGFCNGVKREESLLVKLARGRAGQLQGWRTDETIGALTVWSPRTTRVWQTGAMPQVQAATETTEKTSTTEGTGFIEHLP